MTELIWTDWWLPVVAGPFVGSFLGVLVTRLPAAEPVIAGRSRCPHCDHPLGPRDLVPLVSWLASAFPSAPTSASPLGWYGCTARWCCDRPFPI